MFLLISIIFCILLVGFYSGAETAFISVNRMKLRHLSESGLRSASRVLRLIEDMDRVLATTLIGTNIFVVAASGLFALFMSHIVVQPEEWIVTVILVPIILVFGEILPKSFFRQKANESILILERPILFSTKIFGPIIAIITFISQLIFRQKTRVKKHPKSPFVSREELKYLIWESEREGVVQPREGLFIHSIFNFRQTKIHQVMTNLDKVAMLPDSATGTDVRSMVNQTHFSRCPVYHRDRENIIGVINILDVLYQPEEITSLTPYIRPAIHLDGTTRADEALIRLQSQKQPMAIVTEGQGRNIGLVTIEDLVEEIVGEI